MTPYYSDSLVQIYHGDCRDILPSIEADVIVTDPPYGMAFVAGRRNGKGGWTSRWTGVAISGDSTTADRDFVLDWWGLRPALVFGTWKAPMPARAIEALVWDKVVSTGMGNLSVPWRPSWELIFVLGSGFTGPRSHGVLRYPLATLAPERKDHPTPKPIGLMRDLIQKCPPGTILDPFMGSGSTLVAAKSPNRHAIGIEIEERYCEIAATRCRQEVLGLETA